MKTALESRDPEGRCLGKNTTWQRRLSREYGAAKIRGILAVNDPLVAFSASKLSQD